MTDTPFLWVLHTDGDGQPAICGWAPTEADANKQLEELRAEQQQADFWATTLSEEEAAQYKELGLLPEDAPPASA
jgi:hypothetical protein